MWLERGGVGAAGARPASHTHPHPSLLPPAPPRLPADFPVVYASGIAGIAGPSPEELADDLEPLFDCIVKEVAAPVVQVGAPLCCSVLHSALHCCPSCAVPR